MGSENNLRLDVQRFVREFHMERERTQEGVGASMDFSLRLRVYPESGLVLLTDTSNPALHQTAPASPERQGCATLIIQALIDRALTE